MNDINTTHMIDIDFLEIGTSNFDTLIQSANDDTIGFSVEPIRHYLDQLPNKKQCRKINCAIAVDDKVGDIQIYYIPEHVIIENNLNEALKGCNSVNDYHPAHVRLELTKYVQIDTVQQIPISTFLTQHNIRNIKYLKIDIEGYDADVMLYLYNYLKDKSTIFYPNIIKFETNYLTPVTKVNNIIKLYTDKGYIVSNVYNNTILTKEEIK